MKRRETILDTALQDLFDEGIAREEVLGRVKSIVWENDFFPYEVCIDAIAKKHKGKVMRACGDILRQLICTPEIRLTDLKSAYEDSGIDFNKLTHIICKCGINAIPLEAIYKNSPNPPHVQCLINPYHLLVLDAGKAWDGQPQTALTPFGLTLAQKWQRLCVKSIRQLIGDGEKTVSFHISHVTRNTFYALGHKGLEEYS